MITLNRKEELRLAYIEYCFNKNKRICCVYDMTDGRNYRNRNVEAYNPNTGEFKLSGCKKMFKLQNTKVELTSHYDGVADFWCLEHLDMTFERVQSKIDYLFYHDELAIEWLGYKYGSSKPRKLSGNINGKGFDAVRTYSTVTDVCIGESGFRVGERYSNTSNKYAYKVGYSCIEL